MPGARGETAIRDVGAGQKEVLITAEGLKPNEVYTVWLVNMKPKRDMAGPGGGGFALSNAAPGKGQYAVSASGAGIGRGGGIAGAHPPPPHTRDQEQNGGERRGEGGERRASRLDFRIEDIVEGEKGGEKSWGKGQIEKLDLIDICVVLFIFE